MPQQPFLNFPTSHGWALLAKVCLSTCGVYAFWERACANPDRCFFWFPYLYLHGCLYLSEKLPEVSLCSVKTLIVQESLQSHLFKRNNLLFVSSSCNLRKFVIHEMDICVSRRLKASIPITAFCPVESHYNGTRTHIIIGIHIEIKKRIGSLFSFKNCGVFFFGRRPHHGPDPFNTRLSGKGKMIKGTQRAQSPYWLDVALFPFIHHTSIHVTDIRVYWLSRGIIIRFETLSFEGSQVFSIAFRTSLT